MSLLSRNHWTHDQFFALSEAEQNDWLVWEYQRQQHINEAIKTALNADKPFADTITAQMLIALLRNG